MCVERSTYNDARAACANMGVFLSLDACAAVHGCEAGPEEEGCGFFSDE